MKNFCLTSLIKSISDLLNIQHHEGFHLRIHGMISEKHGRITQIFIIKEEEELIMLAVSRNYNPLTKPTIIKLKWIGNNMKMLDLNLNYYTLSSIKKVQFVGTLSLASKIDWIKLSTECLDERTLKVTLV